MSKIKFESNINVNWNTPVKVCVFREGPTSLTLREVVDKYEIIYTYLAKWSMLWPTYDEDFGLLLVWQKNQPDDALSRVLVPYDKGVTEVTVRDRDIFSDYYDGDCNWTYYPYFRRVDYAKWFFPEGKSHMVKIPYTRTPSDIFRLVYPLATDPKPM